MRQSQYYRGRRKSTAGVSLVEVMASCTIFITASLGAFACIVYGTSTLNVENHRRSAVEVAHSRMETLRTAVFSNLPSLAETDTAVTIDEISGTRDTVVAAIDENSDDTIDYYTVTVSVAWSERGATQSVELVTLFSDPAAAGEAEEPEPPVNTAMFMVVAYRGDGDAGCLATFYVEESGQVSNAVIDTLEFDDDDVRNPVIINVSGSVYAAVYRGDGRDGYVKTVTVGTDGQIGNSVLDSFRFDTGKGEYPSVCLVSSGMIAIAYRASGDEGYVKTVSIGAGGEIGDAVVDSLRFESNECKQPKLIRVAGNVFAVAYEGKNDDGYVKTLTIESNGNIGSVVDSLEFDSQKGQDVDICHVAGEVCAIVYKGRSNCGELITVRIDAAGEIQNSTIDELEFEGNQCDDPKIIQVDADTYAIAYSGHSQDGMVKTVTIQANGQINNSVVDSLEFDSHHGYEPSLRHVSGNYYAVAYRAHHEDGYVKTMTISSTGQIGSSVVDSLLFSGDSKEPYLAAVGTGSVSDMVAHWKFDDGSGSTAVDSAGSNDGTLEHGPTWTTDGRLDGALSFDGHNDHVDVGTMDVSGSAMTISAWMWLADDWEEARVISKASSSSTNGNYWTLAVDDDGGGGGGHHGHHHDDDDDDDEGDGKLKFLLRTDSSGSTTTLEADDLDLAAETWIHVAAVYDGSTMKLYKDGELVGSRSKSGNIATGSGVAVRIGDDPTDSGEEPWAGMLDDIRIYNRALSAEEIQALAAGPGSSSIQLGEWGEE